MTRILALDLGFTTGFGVLERGRAPRSGSHSLKGSSAQMGVAFQSLASLVRRLISEHRPDHIVVAMPFIGRKVTPVQLIPIMAFPCKVQELADEAGIPFERIAEADARKAFMGGIPRGSKAIKDLVVAECQARGWPACDGHAGDALCVAAHKLAKLQPKRAHETTPLFANRRRGKTAPGGKMRGHPASRDGG